MKPRGEPTNGQERSLFVAGSHDQLVRRPALSGLTSALLPGKGTQLLGAGERTLLREGHELSAQEADCLRRAIADG